MPWEAGEGTEALSTSCISNRKSLQINPGQLKLCQARHESLGVFHRIEIAQLPHHDDETTPSRASRRQATQQRFRGLFLALRLVARHAEDL